jgi:hypothetical protein
LELKTGASNLRFRPLYHLLLLLAGPSAGGLVILQCFHRNEEGDRLTFFFSGRFSKDGRCTRFGSKNGFSKGIGSGFFRIKPGEAKLIDTGFLTVVFLRIRKLLYWTVCFWIIGRIGFFGIGLILLSINF